jgi:hypothetical protein
MSPWATPAATFKIERVVQDVINQVIPAASNWTQSIPLGRSDYTHGDLVVANSALASRVNNRRSAGYYKFTTLVQDAQGLGADIATNMISLCVYYDRWNAGYAYRNDTKLSNAFFDIAGSGTILLLSIRINGSNLELIWQNNHPLQPATLTVYVTADVWKDI